MMTTEVELSSTGQDVAAELGVADYVFSSELLFSSDSQILLRIETGPSDRSQLLAE
jgi:hypothetical protein